MSLLTGLTTPDAVRTSAARVPIELRFRAIHLVQVSAQFGVFLYSALYWPPAAHYLIHLALLVMFAYAVDGAVSVLRYGSWMVGYGPLPVVMSSSLFVWFTGSSSWMAFLMIAGAVASKHLFQRRGRHIFNPSGFGLSMVAIACLASPHTLGEVDTSHILNIGPNSLEVIFLLALLVHSRAPVILVTVGAVLFSPFTNAVVGLPFVLLQLPVYTPDVTWAPVYLGITLLVTDPATTPKRPVAQLLFGGVYMAAFALIGSLLDVYGMSVWGEGLDFWAKVLPIPLLNWLAPEFDRFVEARPTLAFSWIEPRFNRRHVAAWATLGVVFLATVHDKPWYFERTLAAGTRFVRFNDTGMATCAVNPTFCRPFSFAGELRLWLR